MVCVSAATKMKLSLLMLAALNVSSQMLAILCTSVSSVVCLVVQWRTFNQNLARESCS